MTDEIFKRPPPLAKYIRAAAPEPDINLSVRIPVSKHKALREKMKQKGVKKVKHLVMSLVDMFIAEE